MNIIRIDREFFLNVQDIKTLRRLTLRERKALSKHLKPGHEPLRTQITFSDGKTWPTTKTIADLRCSGLSTVDNGKGDHIPAENIFGARPVSEKDVDLFTGAALSSVFATVVQTTNGDVYSIHPSNHVLEYAEMAMAGNS